MSKITFKTALSKKTGFDRSSMHITTLDFGKPNVSNIFSVNKGDSVHVNLNQFMRLSPLAVPTYGNIRLITRAFYTPNRILSPNWQAFYSQSLSESYRNLPSFKMETLWSYFTGSSGLLTTDGASANSYDFMIDDAYYLMTDKGRFFYQILLGLGYSVYPVSSKHRVPLKNLSQSFLPLLAYLRIYSDILYPSRFLNNAYFGDLFVLNQFDESTDSQIIFDAFEQTLFVPYEGDFFCNAWASFNSPNGVNSGFTTLPSTSLPDLSSTNQSSVTDSGRIAVTTTGTFATPGENTSIPGNSAYTLSSYGHRLLDAVSDFVLRNNLAGSRFLEYVKAHFGYTTDSERLNYAQFLGSYVSNSNIMDVTSTAETLSSDTGDVLGAQAGKGYISGDGKLSFDVPEVGFIIFISYIVPSYGYYQGMKPWCADKKDRLDFYTPEFDNLGNEPISFTSLISTAPNTSLLSSSDGNVADTVFGFAPRYAFEYKNGHDFLTGDFRCNSRSKGLDSFHTFRHIDFRRSDGKHMVNDIAFQSVDNQYNRIFSSNFVSKAGSYDHFIGYFQFNIKVYSNMRSISDSLPFYNDDGKAVSVDQA